MITTQSQKPLAFFCQASSSLKVKIALTTFYQLKYSHYTEKIIELISHLQLISLTLCLNFSADEFQQFFFKAVSYFLKLMNPSYLLEFDNSDKPTQFLIFLVFGGVILKYALAVYVLIVEYWNKKKCLVLFLVWRWIFKVQGRVLCIFSTSFAVRTIISASNGNSEIFGMNKTGLIIFSAFIVVFEYIFSFIIETQFCEVLPTVNFLSSKNSYTQTIILFQKLVLQILQISFQSHHKINLWIFTIPGLLLSILNNYHFYTRLPLYNFQALLFQGKLLSLVISFDISCFIHACLKEGGSLRANQSLTIGIWIIVSLLAMKLSNELIKGINLLLLNENSQGTPEFLIHKIIAADQLSKDAKTPGEESEKYDLTYILSQISVFNKRTMYRARLSYIAHRTIGSKANELYLDFLEDLLAKFPHNSFIKLYLAYKYSKDSLLFSKTIQIISQLKKSQFSCISLNSLLLIHKIESEILGGFHSEGAYLNLSQFIESQTSIDDLKNEIYDQIKLKLKICENITGEISDIGEIFNCAQKISRSRNLIEKKIKFLINHLPGNFARPFLLYADYSLVLDYSLENYEKFHQYYIIKKFKNEKRSQETTLNNENLYQDRNAFILFSGEKFNSGAILFCSKGIEGMCGKKREKLYGKHISNIFVPSLQTFYKENMRQSLETNTQITPTFLHHRSKYMIEVQTHVQIHPYLTQNLHFNMVIRPIYSGKEYILIKNNGDIESATKNVTNELKLDFSSSKTINIKLLSEELHKANEAYNIFIKNVFANKYEENLTNCVTGSPRFLTESSTFTYNQNEALEIYSREGKIVELFPLIISPNTVKSTGSFSYKCKVSIIQWGSTLMILFILEKVTQSHKEENQNPKNELINTNRSHYKPTFIPPIELNEEQERSDQNEEPNIIVTKTENIAYEGENDNLAPYDGGLSSSRNLLHSNRKIRDFDRFPIINPQPLQNNMKDKAFFEPHSNPLETENVSETQGVSRISRYKRQEKAFQSGVSSKSYPKTFFIWVLIFFGAVLMTCVSQIILFEVSKKTMHKLVIKKDLLRYSQTRFYRIVLLNLNCIGVFLYLEGLTPVTDILREASAAIENLRGHLPELVYSNNRIFQGLNSLDIDVKKHLFLKDVRINETTYGNLDYNVYNVTQFQAVEHIISSTITLLANVDSSISEMSRISYFLVLNTLGDFVFKNSEMTNLFQYLVNKEAELFQQVLFLCLIIAPILLLCVTLILILIIGIQYKTEKDYFLAFIKLNHKKVESIEESLKSFERNLKSDQEFGRDQTSTFLSILTTPPKDTHNKKKGSHIIKYSTIQSRYRGYVIKVITYISILIVILVANFLTANSTKQRIYRKQSQLQFANQLSDIVSITYGASCFMFIFNNTVNVSNEKPFTLMSKNLVQIKKLQEQMLDIYTELDQTYDPKIKDILFDRTDCQGLTGSAIYFCGIFRQQGRRTTLVSVMGIFENLVETALRSYINSNKTSIPLIVDVSNSLQDSYLPAFVLSAAKTQLIADIIDKNLMEDISKAHSQMTIFLIIFSISIACASVLIWLHILSKLREIDNDFKKVLRVFPSILILSSFLLKKFLKKTSRDFINL